MGLRDIVRKKDKLAAESSSPTSAAAPEVTFIRSDTFSREVIHPPSDAQPVSPGGGGGGYGESSSSRFFSRSRGSSFSSSKASGAQDSSSSFQRPGTHRRLSQRLHLRRSPVSSENVPANLPEITGEGEEWEEGEGEGDAGDKDRKEQQWEKRATMLAQANDVIRSSRPGTPDGPTRSSPHTSASGGGRGSNNNKGASASKETDLDIQEAIRLHEEGRLEESTRMFRVLADPRGKNNPLSQVLYGLALRHGWGCEPNPAAAITYLSAAASNAALVENLALQAGLKKGGAAKGELVLAIYELANCFRHGWGIDIDPIAAKQYYETAANLGDTDAMNDIAWCYLEGFGCKKDKFAAAKYYRLAEKNGNKTLGNTWIWKEKYDPGNGKHKK